MKLISPKISELVSSITAFSKGIHRRHTLTHPTRDWGIGLFVWFLIAVICIVWSGHLYVYYQQERSVFEFEAPASNQLYRSELVAQALEIMIERSLERERLLGVVALTNESDSTTDDLVETGGEEVVATPDEVESQDDLNSASEITPVVDSEDQSAITSDVESEAALVPVLE